MRNKYCTIALMMALFVAAFATAQQASQALLDQARAKKTSGDLQGAVEGFDAVVTGAGSNRKLAATALLELGDTFDSLGQAARARSYYERVKNEYADQAAETAIAADRLAKVSNQGKPAGITIKTPYTEDAYSFAISPDGRTLVYQAIAADGKRQLWRQAVDASAKPEPIAGTEGAGASSFPFFSPDGKSVAFFAGRKLYQVDLAGGTRKELSDAPTPSGGTWSNGGIVMAARGFAGPVEGLKNGTLTALTTPNGFFVGPKFLDDRRFLYFSREGRGGGKLEVGALDGPTVPARGMPAAHAGSYANGYLFFVTTAGSLNAVKFDARDLTVSGQPITIAAKVGKEDRSPGVAAFSVSAAGPVAYREAATSKRQMMWMSRTGDPDGNVGSADTASPAAPRISRDGRFVLFFRQTGSPLGSMWVMETDGGSQRQLRDAASTAVWSPDGDRIMFAAMRTGGTGGITGPLMLDQPISQNGNIAGRMVGPTNGVAFPEDWSPNGFFLFRAQSGTPGGGGMDLFVLSPDRSETTPVAVTPASEKNARFSPDGNWIAYQSDESGRNEVYVQPFPGSMAQRQRVSLSGGVSPQWGRKGKELYFLSPTNQLIVAGATTGIADSRRTIEFAIPKALFSNPLPQGAEYDTASDGDRFLVLAPVEEAPPIIVLNDWNGAAGRR